MTQELAEQLEILPKPKKSEIHAVVRYNNGLNTTPLRGFTPVEMDIFWAVVSTMKMKGTKEVTFSFSRFRALANYDRREKDSFYNALRSMSDKLGTLTYRYEDKEVYDQLWLFQRFRINKDDETVTIKANEEFEFILNSISSNFTRFEMDNMTKLKSGYSKELYRHLMQFRSNQTQSGYWVVSVEDFKRALSIPDSYRMSNINVRVIEQAKKEFLAPDPETGRPIFEYFEVEKIKARRGNKIDRLKCIFKEPKSLLPEVSLFNWLEDGVE